MKHLSILLLLFAFSVSALLAQPDRRPTRSIGNDYSIRAGGTERAVLTAQGQFGLNVNPPTKYVDLRFMDQTRYHQNKWGMEGMLLYNNWNTTTTGHGAAITLAAIGGQGAHMARAMISGQVVDADRMDIVFQNEFGAPDLMRESMRITSEGFVGIGITQSRPARTLHTAGTIRFSALEYGTGDVLVVDDNGDVFRSQAGQAREGRREPRASSNEIEILERRIRLLEADVIELQKALQRQER
ncbi:MAG: hypothetical protein M5R41_00860 [Bacteroidia bacterium]|nr:hypothetical protein [Bacteroidia bacterium]